MYICVKCRREMQCLKNGVGADFGFGHVYPGDMFECRFCGIKILATNRNSIYDPEHRTQEAYVLMEEGNVVPKG